MINKYALIKGNYFILVLTENKLCLVKFTYCSTFA